MDTNKPSPYRYNGSLTLAFYRGRHIQTIKVAPRRWDAHLSCPAFPGKAYAIAISLAGYRPGVRLPDGRRIHLNLDHAVALSMRGQLRPLFDPGPGRLDANVGAIGSIDLGSIPSNLGIPMWIAMAVLDFAAPLGIAYLPDTYVFRL